MACFSSLRSLACDIRGVESTQKRLPEHKHDVRQVGICEAGCAKQRVATAKHASLSGLEAAILLHNSEHNRSVVACTLSRRQQTHARGDCQVE